MFVEERIDVSKQHLSTTSRYLYYEFLTQRAENELADVIRHNSDHSLLSSDTKESLQLI